MGSARGVPYLFFKEFATLIPTLTCTYLSGVEISAIVSLQMFALHFFKEGKRKSELWKV